MAEEITLDADIRGDFLGKKLYQLRLQGKIPAVVYGPDLKPVPIIVDEKGFKVVITTEHGENVLIKLKVEKKKPVTTIVKEIQVHPVTMKIIHVDFCQVKLTEKMEVEVPVVVEGEAPGVKTAGGVLEHVIRAVKVSCLPKDIPDQFVLDVSQMSIGDNLKVADIAEIKGVEILGDPEGVIVSIVPPTEIKEPEEGELEAEAEPEIIGKEKKEGEEVKEKGKEEEAEPEKKPPEKETKE